jgi:hypothetical protein
MSWIYFHTRADASAVASEHSSGAQSEVATNQLFAMSFRAGALSCVLGHSVRRLCYQHMRMPTVRTSSNAADPNPEPELY